MTESPADKSFTRSDAHAFNGIDLQPYTPSRVVAAQAMGLKYPNIGQDAIESFNKTGVYPGALQDVLIVLWLCSLEQDKSVTRAMRAPDEALGYAIDWGAKRGITNTKSETWWTAYDVFIEIMVEINNSRGSPQITDATPDDDDPNE